MFAFQVAKAKKDAEKKIRMANKNHKEDQKKLAQARKEAAQAKADAKAAKILAEKEMKKSKKAEQLAQELQDAQLAADLATSGEVTVTSGQEWADKVNSGKGAEFLQWALELPHSSDKEASFVVGCSLYMMQRINSTSIENLKGASKRFSDDIGTWPSAYKPFPNITELEQFQIDLAARIWADQTIAAANNDQSTVHTADGSNALIEMIKQINPEKSDENAPLPFKLEDRATEVGWANVPDEAWPTENTMRAHNNKAKHARAKGHVYTGSGLPNDLVKNYVPPTVRAEEKAAAAKSDALSIIKDALNKAADDETTEVANTTMTVWSCRGYWLKVLVFDKVITTADAFASTSLMTDLVREHGARIARAYDEKCRAALARAASRGKTGIEIAHILTTLDEDLVKKALTDDMKKDFKDMSEKAGKAAKRRQEDDKKAFSARKKRDEQQRKRRRHNQDNDDGNTDQPDAGKGKGKGKGHKKTDDKSGP